MPAPISYLFMLLGIMGCLGNLSLHHNVLAENINTSTKGIEKSDTGSLLSIITTSVISGGIIGGAASVLTTYLNNKHNKDIKQLELNSNLKNSKDLKIFDTRMEVYLLLWKRMKNIAFFADPSETITIDDAKKIRESFTSWYYEEKGKTVKRNTWTFKRSYQRSLIIHHRRYHELG